MLRDLKIFPSVSATPTVVLLSGNMVVTERSVWFHSIMGLSQWERITILENVRRSYLNTVTRGPDHCLAFR